VRRRALVLIPLALIGLIGLFFLLRPDDAPGGPRERDVEASIEGGVMEPSEVVVGEGDEVTLRVTSEEAVELHVHGYDLEEEVEPDEPATLSFEAEETGRFGIEDHETGEELGALLVEPR
jgi:heme/copper-type cytochrome/quinol oxidase subunit 2